METEQNMQLFFIYKIYFNRVHFNKICDDFLLNNFKNGENDIGHIYSVGSDFNRVIELNQKMLILKRFVTKNDF